MRLQELLKQVGVDVTFITVEGGEHGGFASSELSDRVKAFFDKHLRGVDATIKGGSIPNRQ